MNSTLIAGLIVGALVILGGIALVVYGPSDSTSTTATTTPTTTTNPDPVATHTPGVPTVTTGTLVTVSNSTALVTGKVYPGGSQTSYSYEYGPTSALGTRTGAQAVGSGYANITAPALITGLSTHTKYYFRLSAVNAYGTVVGQVYSFTTDDTTPTTGTAPTTNTDGASTITRVSANVNGRVTPNNSETSTWFEYGETTDFGNTTSFQTAGDGAISKTVAAALSGLKPVTTYYFRMNAQNQYGTVNGSTHSFTTNGPAAPSAPTVDTSSASNVATSSATLRGTLNPNGVATTYWFEYSRDSLLGSLLGTSTHTDLTGSGTATISVSTDVTGINSNTKFYYQLVASNSYGTVRGDIVSFTTAR